jgi:molybdate transport system ATP-binding protein
MSLHAAIELSLGALHLDVTLDVDDDAVVAVVGPNGAGKTTIVRAIAGLIPIDRGRVVINDTDVTRLPPEQRHLGVVFQEHRLFPHLTAEENVAFGLRANGASRADSRAAATAWLQRVGLPNVAQRRPASLSGGEAQRVALARALAAEPSVLLLDEPLAAADASARADLRHLLRAELRRYPGARVVVTHDPIEAAALADVLVVVEDGRITQRGPLAEVTARPTSPWVATMVGLNLVEGVAIGTAVRLANGALLTTATPANGSVFVAIRPNAVTVHRDRPSGSARNIWAGQASDLHIAGDRARVRITGDVPLIAEVTPAAVAQLRLADGGPIWASVKATDLDVYAA